MISQIMELNEKSTTPSDFSIDHILNRAGTSFSGSSVSDTRGNSEVYFDAFSWLQCTRYCPPKVPRLHKRQGPQKRQLGRHPRIPFTSHQLSLLEAKFQQSAYLSSEEVTLLSHQLQLADIRVKIWFQNRRARERREKITINNPENCERKENSNLNLISEGKPENSTFGVNRSDDD